MLDRKIFFDLSKHTKCKVGRKKASGEDHQIVLGGVGIQNDHAIFETSGGETKLKALDKEAQ